MSSPFQWMLEDHMVKLHELASHEKVILNQTKDEIEQWSTQHFQSEKDKVLTLFNSGLQEQKLWAIRSLPKVLLEDPTAYEGVDLILVGFIQERISFMEDEMLSASGDCFNDMLHYGKFDLKYLDSLLTAIPCVLNSSCQEVTSKWLDVLFKLAQVLPVDILTGSMMRIIYQLSSFSQSTMMKCHATSILASIACALKENINDEIFKKGISLCFDLSIQVRSFMCKNFRRYVQWISSAKIFKNLDDIFEIGQDDAIEVRQQFVKLLAVLVQHFELKDYKQKIHTLFKEHLLKRTDNKIISIILKNFGAIAYNLFNQFDEFDDYLMQWFMQQSQSQDLEFRERAVKNLPGLALIWKTKILSILISYSNDQNETVRCILVRCFPKLLQILTASQQDYVKSELSFYFMKLFEDLDLRIEMLDEITLVLENLEIDKDYFTDKMIEILQLSSNWRIQVKVMKKFQECLQYLNLKYTIATFVPVVYMFLEEGVMPVKDQAAILLSEIIHQSYYEDKRRDICNYILQKYGQGFSAQKRITFLKIVKSLLEKMSIKFVKQYFLENILNLANDQIIDVQLYFLSNIQYFRQCADNMQLEDSFRAILDRYMESDNNYIADLATSGRSTILSQQYQQMIHGHDFIENQDLKVAFEAEQHEKFIKEQEDDKHKLIEQLTIRAKKEFSRLPKEKKRHSTFSHTMASKTFEKKTTNPQQIRRKDSRSYSITKASLNQFIKMRLISRYMSNYRQKVTIKVPKDTETFFEPKWAKWLWLFSLLPGVKFVHQLKNELDYDEQFKLRLRNVGSWLALSTLAQGSLLLLFQYLKYQPAKGLLLFSGTGRYIASAMHLPTSLLIYQSTQNENTNRMLGYSAIGIVNSLYGLVAGRLRYLPKWVAYSYWTFGCLQINICLYTIYLIKNRKQNSEEINEQI